MGPQGWRLSGSRVTSLFKLEQNQEISVANERQESSFLVVAERSWEMRPPEAETCAVGDENEGERASPCPELGWAEMGEQQWWVLGVQRAHRVVPVPVLGATAGSCGSLAPRPAQRRFGEKWI